MGGMAPTDYFEEQCWTIKEQLTGTAPSQNHYTQHAVQPIEIMQMYLSKEEFEGFLKGNVIKYSLRANYKGQKQKDVDKAYQYAKWLGQAQRGEKINPREE